MQTQIAILSDHTIFAEGIASRLRQFPHRVDVQFVDPQQSNYINAIEALDPAAVIIDAAETSQAQCCLLCELLLALPSLTIIRLEAQKKDVQVIRSSQHEMTEVLDIISTIEQ